MCIRDRDGADTAGLAIGVFNGHLGFAVGPHPGQCAVSAHFGQAAGQAVGQINGHGHQHVGFVAGKAEHHALIAGADGIDLGVAIAVLAHFQRVIHALGDVGTLRGNGRLDAAGVAVEALAAVVETDIDDDLAHQLVEIDETGRRDFAQEQDEAGLDRRLAGHAGHGVLGQQGIEHGITDLVAHLIRMSFGHGLRSEQDAGRLHKGCRHWFGYLHKFIANGREL